MSAYKDENSEGLVDMTCSFMQDEKHIDSVAYKYENIINSDFEFYDFSFDSKYSIKYEILNATALSERQVKNTLSQLSNSNILSDDDIDYIDKIMNVKVKITAKHGSDSTSLSKNIYFAKESGNWKLLNVE